LKMPWFTFTSHLVSKDRFSGSGVRLQAAAQSGLRLRRLPPPGARHPAS
jgi:hypothetical protein